MLPGDQKRDPELPAPDGRSENEKRFIDFPENPDLYGHIDPFERQKPKSPEYRDFAPPGQPPEIGNPRDPIHGVDGRGSLLVTGPQKPRGRRVIGDYEEMVGMGILPPGPDMRMGPDMPFGARGGPGMRMDPDMPFGGGPLGFPPGRKGGKGGFGSPGFGPGGFGGPGFGF